jgi:hypothetical protein
MTFTDRTNPRSQWKEHAMELILAIGEAFGLAFGMPTTRRSKEWS